ncbi:MAG: leucine-rich repeat protein [Lachnospiraceae bacterium]|nr:leucine-rich repeat protein [Lachnospiraceae bacterium]
MIFKEKLAEYLERYEFFELRKILEKVVFIVDKELLNRNFISCHQYKEDILKDNQLIEETLEAKLIAPIKLDQEYTIVISSDNPNSKDIILKVIHELQHIACYVGSLDNKMNSIESMPCQSFLCWSEFRATYTEIMLEIYMNIETDTKGIFKLQAEILGREAAICVGKSFQIEDKYSAFEYIFRYLGASAAVKSFSKKENKGSWVFYQKSLMPFAIFENYFLLYNIAQNWEDLMTRGFMTHDLYDNSELQNIEECLETMELEWVYHGKCGDNLYWKIIESVLYIYGSGKMWDWDPHSAPWTGEFDKVIISNGVTSIGSCAFYEVYINSIKIPDSVKIIGWGAFSDSDIDKLELRDTIELVDWAIIDGDPCKVHTLIVSANIKTFLPEAFHTRSGAPGKIIFTGNLPDSLSSLVKSNIFLLSTSIYYPKHWDMGLDTFYERILKEIKQQKENIEIINDMGEQRINKYFDKLKQRLIPLDK